MEGNSSQEMLGSAGFSPKVPSRRLCLYLQTMAILAELGAPRLSAVLGVEHEQVSLAACNLLHVMFDSLREGLQKDFRGKEDAVVLGEWLLPQLVWAGAELRWVLLLPASGPGFTWA